MPYSRVRGEHQHATHAKRYPNLTHTKTFWIYYDPAGRGEWMSPLYLKTRERGSRSQLGELKCLWHLRDAADWCLTAGWELSIEGEAVHVVGQVEQGNSIPSSQFCCVPETALKSKVCFSKKWPEVWWVFLHVLPGGQQDPQQSESRWQ